MADKKFDKAIDDAIDKLLKDYKQAARTAAVYATEKTMEEFIDTAYFGLKTYYDTYKPKKYKRKYFLSECITQFQNISYTNNGIVCSFGINYDSSMLKDLYDYDYGRDKPSRFYRQREEPTILKKEKKESIIYGKKTYIDYTTYNFDEGKTVSGELFPINEWIMNNFLEGIHPTTERSCKLNAKYIPEQRTSPEVLMDRYIKTAESQFSKYFMISLLNQL